MITLEQLFGPWHDHPDATIERKANAKVLLIAVNNLLDEAKQEGVTIPINPTTHSEVSGTTLGGFRPQACAIGSPNSAHKQGRAVDVYDPRESLDTWLDDDTLEAFGLYREAPSATRGWVHLTDRSPTSNKRTFLP